jgi:hypothetical protein
MCLDLYAFVSDRGESRNREQCGECGAESIVGSSGSRAPPELKCRDQFGTASPNSDDPGAEDHFQEMTEASQCGIWATLHRPRSSTRFGSPVTSIRCARGLANAACRRLGKPSGRTHTLEARGSIDLLRALRIFAVNPFSCQPDRSVAV